MFTFHNLVGLKQSCGLRTSAHVFVVRGLRTQLHYTCFQWGHNASLNTSGGGLADQITIRPIFALSAFPPVLSCGQAPPHYPSMIIR